MTKKSTKRSLLLSVLALLVCASMLVGTTFAWFTDSVTSAGNIIKSGTLDVTMDWFDGTKVVPAVNSTDWKDASTGAIFNYTLWEPGYTEVRHIKIENKGSLALKYQLSIVPNGEVEELADVIDVYYLDPASQVADRTALTDANKLGTLTEVLANLPSSAYGELKSGENHTVTLALKMQETAGNEYQDKQIGTSFSVQLFATQLTYEPDSFDNTYDETAPIPTVWTGTSSYDWYLANPTASVFELGTAEELAALAAIVNGTADGIAQDTFSGQTIKLTSDIDLADLPWTTIGRNHDVEGADPFSGTFDGQGHTVYNLNIHIDDNQRDSVGFIGLAKNANIKGLTIENVDINADYFVGAIVGKLTSGEIYDCHVTGDINIVSRRNYAAGIVSDGYYNMENCSVIADGMGNITSAAVAGGLAGRINEGAHYIKNCTVKNMNVKSGQQIAAISGFVHYGNTISGCTAENVNLTLTVTSPSKPSIGLVSGLWYYNAAKPITMSDNTFKNVTISATSNATGNTNILHGWEWSNNMTGVVESGNTLDNVVNNLIYQ